MTTLETLERRIREKLAASEAHWHAKQDELRRQMRERASSEERNDETKIPDDALSRYSQIADRLMEEVIQPRLEKLVSCFDNVQVPEGQGGGHRCFYRFERTLRFPATATVEVWVSRDGQVKTLEVCWGVSIIPAYGAMPPPPDRLSMPVNEVDEDQVARWVEEKILTFLDAYLRLETEESYQEGNWVSDPVCGMFLNKAAVPAQCEFGGYTFYFCTEGCRTKFLDEMTRTVKELHF